jgi:hypothetical protein
VEVFQSLKILTCKFEKILTDGEVVGGHLSESGSRTSLQDATKVLQSYVSGGLPSSVTPHTSEFFRPNKAFCSRERIHKVQSMFLFQFDMEMVFVLQRNSFLMATSIFSIRSFPSTPPSGKRSSLIISIRFCSVAVITPDSDHLSVFRQPRFDSGQDLHQPVLAGRFFGAWLAPRRTA